MLILWLACTPHSPGTIPAISDAEAPPAPPDALTRWLVGDEADAVGQPTGPMLLIAGGGGDVDAAIAAWLAAGGGGDVVVLRTSGEDGYNDYMLDDPGGVDSVETLRVDTVALADDPYVAWRLQTAEAVFMAGGDQATYLSTWTGTATGAALDGLWARGAAIGGTSAGAAVLGQRAFSASAGTVYSDEALADPFNPYMLFQDGFLDLPPLAGVVTDTHFYQRDRMGRLVAFAARAIADGLGEEFVGIGVDEDTAVLVAADGSARVYGDGYAYVLHASRPATVCTPGEPLSVSGWTYHVVHPGDALSLPAGTSDGPTYPLDVDAGRLIPADPY